MAYLPPHKRHSGGGSDHAPPTSSLGSLSLSSSSPRGRHQLRPRPSNNKIIHAVGCVSRWSLLPPFSPDSDDADSFRLEPFSCEPVERKAGAQPLVLSLSSPKGKGSSGSAEAAIAAIAQRFLPEHLAAAERSRAPTHDVIPNNNKDEVLKLSLVARAGKVLFQPGGSHVSLDSLCNTAKAGNEGSKSQVRKSFNTNMPREYFEDMEQSAVLVAFLTFRTPCLPAFFTGSGEYKSSRGSRTAFVLGLSLISDLLLAFLITVEHDTSSSRWCVC